MKPINELLQAVETQKSVDEDTVSHSTEVISVHHLLNWNMADPERFVPRALDSTRSRRCGEPKEAH